MARQLKINDIRLAILGGLAIYHIPDGEKSIAAVHYGSPLALPKKLMFAAETLKETSYGAVCICTSVRLSNSAYCVGTLRTQSYRHNLLKPSALVQGHNVAKQGRLPDFFQKRTHLSVPVLKAFYAKDICGTEDEQAQIGLLAMTLCSDLTLSALMPT